MFDDPKKELKRLEEQLLAAEEEQWAESAFLPEEEEPAEPEAGGRFLLPEEPEAPPEPEEAPGRPNIRVPILVAALLLEVAALFAVLAWWVLWR